MKTAIEEKDEQISNLNSFNEDLKLYIDRLEKIHNLVTFRKRYLRGEEKRKNIENTPFPC